MRSEKDGIGLLAKLELFIDFCGLSFIRSIACARFATQKDNVFLIDVIAVRNVASVKLPVGGLRGVFAGSLASEAETENRPLQSYVLIC